MHAVIPLFVLVCAFYCSDRYVAWADPNIPQSEFNALWTIYNTTDGDYWFWLESGNIWNFASTANPCIEDWQGVTCSTSPIGGDLHVIALNLDQQGLYGSFPASIGELPYLRNLTLDYNFLYGLLPAEPWLTLTELSLVSLRLNWITGPIPDTFGALQTLQYIALGYNAFTGPIPANIMDLTGLQVLDCGYNYLNETIPENIDNLVNLEVLSLSGNLFGGQFPQGILALRQLTFLSIGSNQLSGVIPPALGELQNLTVLYVNNNYFTGLWPSNVAMLYALQYLDISANEFSGEIISQLAGFTNAIEMDIGDNLFSGTIDASVTFAFSLGVFYLDGNRLSGTVPTAFSQLPYLTELVVSTNQFTGTFPAALAQLQYLGTLDLSNNFLDGTIPAALSSLGALTNLALSGNGFHGALPVALASIPQLTELHVHAYRLTGTVPDAFYALDGLSVLDVSDNAFTGTIPTGILSMNALTELYLYGNDLRGTIPSEVCLLPQLAKLYLDDNALTGTIPSNIGYLWNLQYLVVSDNYLTGTIPSQLAQAYYLTELVLSGNFLTGTLSADLSTFAYLDALVLDTNLFTGTIPSSLGSLAKLQYMSLSRNRFRGAIPDALGNLGILLDLVITSCGITGTIPSALGHLQRLQNLQLQENHLRGTIPAELSGMEDIAVLNVSFNALTGRVPTSFSQLRNLQQLYVLNNQLTGTLDGVFDPTTQSRISVVSVSNNAITGTLPDALFQLPELSSLIAAQNCFTGTLPATVCESLLLSSLNLDGLHTATACKHRIIPGTGIYQNSDAFHGTIPSCLVNLPALSSLHLTGNGLTGTIPGITSSSSQLIELVLAHNTLSGSIPEAVQTHNWRKLDLSFNRLDGSLQSDFGANLGPTSATVEGIEITSEGNTVKLQNNRLSGRIPSALVHLQNISMLGSNMFSCDADRSDLPAEDSDRDRYQCASDSFNSQIYTALALVCGLAAVWVCRRWWPSIVKTALLRLEQRFAVVRLDVESLPSKMRLFDAISDVLCNVAIVSTALIVLCLLPWYAIAHSFFGTYTHTYAWVVSAAFLSGLTPAVTSLLLYCALMVTVVLIAAVFVGRTESRMHPLVVTTHSAASSASNVNGPPVSSSARRPPTWQRRAVYALFLTINMAVVLGVNIGFVAITLSSDNAVVTLAQLLLSLFKLAWNAVCTPAMIDFVTMVNGQDHMNQSMLTITMFLSLVNNIVIPCLVVAAQSPSCFNEWFSSTPSVSAVYTIPGCYLQYQDSTYNYTTVCSFSSPVELSTTFNPLFGYGYQCSSSFITDYAPAFVYLGLAAGIGVPIANAAMLWFYNRATPDSPWHVVLTTFVPTILKSIVGVGAGGASDAIQERLLDVNALVSTLVTYLGILLTFGVVFPPLAAVMCATMLSVAWQTRVSIGRALYDTQGAGSTHVIEALERDCSVVLSVANLRRLLFIIVSISCSFYAMFLFDTLGDAEGLNSSYWVLIVMPAFPIVLYGLDHLLRLRSGRKGTSSTAFSQDQGAVELAVFGGAVASSTVVVRGISVEGGKVDSMSDVIMSHGVVNALHEP